MILGGPNTNINETWTTTFYLRSTVLGANVVEINDNGVKTKGYVYANGERLARQEVFPSSSAVTWYHPNAGTNSWVETTSNRWVTRQEMDPVGAEVGTADPFIADPEPTYLDIKGQEPLYIDGGDPFDYSGGCTSFGMPISCSDAAHYLGSGLGQINGITTNGVNPRGPQNGGTREYVDETRIGPFWINDIRYQYADEGRFVESPYVAPQKPAPTGRPSQKLTGCVFDISVTTNGLINSKQLQAMKDEISRVFATAGQEINFVHSNANYYLSVNAVGANYTNNSEAVGLTPLSGSAVTNNGRVFVDRLTTSANIEAASSTAFNQNSNALAVGLGRAGSHEISHYLLQQNYDLRSITGVMHSGFKGSEWFAKTSEGLWKFTPAQIKQLNSLCGR